MLNCTIIFNEQEYTLAEFKSYIMENGMGSLLGDSPSQLAQNIVTKFDYKNQDESISEMWARLDSKKKGESFPELPTKKDVEKVLNPSGQLTDYGTQRQIRYNTYSGIALTGISANFGKGLGYLFEASPILSIKDTATGELIQKDSPEWKALIGKSTVEALLQRSNKYEVAERSDPKVKSAFGFTIDGEKIDSFVRTTRGKTANIFETIDTIINLAIDNVKEGQLHLLGITNANANAFLTLVGMGVPLNTVSKIFKSPVIANLNNSGKRFDKDVLQAEIDRISEQYGVDEAGVPTTVSTALLDKIYLGEISEELRSAHDISTLKLVQNLSEIGSELFDYAKIYGSLRSLPNKKWQIDDLVSTIEKYNTFTDEFQTQAQIRKLFKETISETFQKNSAEYQKLVAEDNQAAADSLLEREVQSQIDDKSLFGTYRAEVRANYVNRALRRAQNRNLESTDKSVFADTVVLRMPHIMASYRTLLQTQTILAKSFAVYNKVVSDFVKNLISEANIFTEYGSSAAVETISKELIKFLSSNLEFDLDNSKFSTEIDPNTTFYTATSTYKGKEAWAQNFIHNIKDIQNIEAFRDNAFVNAIEIIPGADGLFSVKIVGDKVNDEEVLESIKEDFLDFARSSVPLTEGYTAKQAAVDLFKYTLMTSGMYFERTGFSLIFPPHWTVAYSLALDQRLQAVIPNGQHLTDLNLLVLKDKFLVQLLANNEKLIRKQRDGSPIKQKQIKSGNRTETSFSGKDELEGREVWFDLKIPLAYSPDASRKLTTHYTGGVYALIPTPGSAFTYYTKVANTPKHRFYDFDVTRIDSALNLLPLTSGEYPVVHNGDIRNGVLTTEEVEPIYEEGMEILAFDKLDPAVTGAVKYRIKSKKAQGKGFKYILDFVEKISLTKEAEAAQRRRNATKFLPDRLANTIVVSNLEKYRKQIFESRNTAAFEFTIPAMTPNMTEEEQYEVTKDLVSQITSKDATLNYFIQSDILDFLDDYPNIKQAVASKLSEVLGFRHNTKVDISAESAALQKKLDRLLIVKHTLHTGNPVKSVEGAPYTHFLERASNLNHIEAGDILFNGTNVYFHVQEKTAEGFNLSQFSEAVFSLMDANKDNYTKEEFENLYNKTINC